MEKLLTFQPIKKEIKKIKTLQPFNKNLNKTIIIDKQINKLMKQCLKKDYLIYLDQLLNIDNLYFIMILINCLI